MLTPNRVGTLDYSTIGKGEKMLIERTKSEEVTHKLNEVVYNAQLPRPYLGLSMVGNKCLRYLQYYHYWAFKTSHSVRVQRLFTVGHDAEPKIVADLDTVGIHVFGDQQRIIGTAGHWMGHIDGKVEGSDINTGDGEALVEFKTHNDKSFKLLQKDGMKNSKPMHYSQMQAYMGYLGMSNGMYFAINKNTSEYYMEVIDSDEEHFTDLKRKEMEVIASDVILPKIGNGSKTWFECKFCDAKDTCHSGQKIEKSCRSCEFVDVLDDGKWACSHGSELSNAEQIMACDKYSLAEMFNND